MSTRFHHIGAICVAKEEYSNSQYNYEINEKLGKLEFVANYG